MNFYIKYKYAVVIPFLVAMMAMGQHNHISIVPEPSETTVSEGVFEISEESYIYLDFDAAKQEALQLQQLIADKTGTELPVTSEKRKTPKTISIVRNGKIKNPEGYSLTIGENGLELGASNRKGVFYALKTLEQLFPVALEGRPSESLPYVHIEDAPRFGYRALMLDPARHFLPIEDVKKYVEAMASYKFNVLHLHLTDDQGWRIEIKKYPKLTEIGSKRVETNGNGKAHEGYYTQEQLKDLVSFAKERHVEIIPEIDMPGHGMSILAAYPELACFPQKFEVSTKPGVSKELLCAGKEEVYTFYENVIEEVVAVFPNKKLHIGGDEAPLDRWRESPHCQKVIKKNGLHGEEGLMVHFFGRIKQDSRKARQGTPFMVRK